MSVETRPEAHVREAYSRESVEPEDYAAINAVYGLLLAVLVRATRERARTDPIRNSELLPLAAATFAVSKVVAR